MLAGKGVAGSEKAWRATGTFARNRQLNEVAPRFNRRAWDYDKGVRKDPAIQRGGCSELRRVFKTTHSGAGVSGRRKEEIRFGKGEILPGEEAKSGHRHVNASVQNETPKPGKEAAVAGYSQD